MFLILWSVHFVQESKKPVETSQTMTSEVPIVHTETKTITYESAEVYIYLVNSYFENF